jgi:glycine cleavage system H protein
MTTKYTKDHEWIKIEGEVATIGITKHAADALGELVYVELPEAGDSFDKGDAAVVVESSKSASDVYAPLSGEVTAVNETLESNPENVNQAPYSDGWLIKVKFSSIGDLEGYMNEDEYTSFLKEEA